MMEKETVYTLQIKKRHIWQNNMPRVYWTRGILFAGRGAFYITAFPQWYKSVSWNLPSQGMGL